MTKPIPKLGTYKTLDGNKLIHCGIQRDLVLSHPKVKFNTILNSIPDTPDGWIDHTDLYLPKKEWKRLNNAFKVNPYTHTIDNGVKWKVEVKSGIITLPSGEAVHLDNLVLCNDKDNHKTTERDLSLVMDDLNLLVPEVREQVIRLANNSSDFYFKEYTRPKGIRQLFKWSQGCREEYDNWSSINRAIENPSLRKDNPAFIQPFEWIKDRPPTEEDADGDGCVVFYKEDIRTNWYFIHFEDDMIESGLPWARFEDVEHFTENNPAPSPFNQ